MYAVPVRVWRKIDRAVFWFRLHNGWKKFEFHENVRRYRVAEYKFTFMSFYYQTAHFRLVLQHQCLYFIGTEHPLTKGGVKFKGKLPLHMHKMFMPFSLFLFFPVHTHSLFPFVYLSFYLFRKISATIYFLHKHTMPAIVLYRSEFYQM